MLVTSQEFNSVSEEFITRVCDSFRITRDSIILVGEDKDQEYLPLEVVVDTMELIKEQSSQSRTSAPSPLTIR